MAAKEARIKGAQPHLADMFSSGKICTVVYPDKPEIEVWVTRPSPAYNQKAQKAARVARARRFRELSSDDSEEAMALEVQVDAMTKKELVENLATRSQRTFEQQAYNEVMYAEPEDGNETTKFGKYWGPEGSQYIDLLDAQIARMEEIKAHNAEQEAGGGDDIINPLQDEEMLRLNEVSGEFEKQVRARVETLLQDDRNEIASRPIDKLRRELKTELRDAECDMLWYTTYRLHMLYYAVRFPDEHKKLYFASADQLDDLPDPIKQQLYDYYEKVDQGAEQTKNLLTPLPS